VGTVLEHYAWAAVVAGWSLLLLLGLAGGDPFAVVEPRRAAPPVRFVQWAARAWASQRRDVPAAGVGAELPARPAVMPPATESGLHAVV
jgi:hypothetical protein